MWGDRAATQCNNGGWAPRPVQKVAVKAVVRREADGGSPVASLRQARRPPRPAVLKDNILGNL